MNSIIRNEFAGSMLGVEGRFRNVVADDTTGRILDQEFLASRLHKDQYVKVFVSFDDKCRNGHETFSITGGTRHTGGCIHDTISEAFPELEPLIKWHLVSTDGPMHYVGNTIYLAGDRDHWGLRKGEKRQVRHRGTTLLRWNLVSIIDGEEAPLKTNILSESEPVAPVVKYVPEYITGEGKERQFDAARSVAVWPEATDEQLSLPKEELTELLNARLPALMEAFKADMVAAGFLYPKPKE